MDLRLGVKIYDNDWFLRHRLTATEAADLLAEWGVIYVIAQSKLLPMANSAVTSAVGDTERRAYDALDDVVFRNMLRERDIAYFACLNIGFDPVFSAAHSDVAAIDQWGRPGLMQNWYVGLPPDREENLDHKVALLRRGVAALTPDGVHLGFIRWPGFWETWLPGDMRADKPEYCFSKRTISAFNGDTGLDIPLESPSAAAAAILADNRDAWTHWKCKTTVGAIRRIRRELGAVCDDLSYSINTLPFFRSDFDNAVEEVFGQDISMLSEVVDVFEVMAYHQILAQQPDWPARVASDIRARSGRQVVCTLQAKALYLEGMHAGRGRTAELTAEEFSEALNALAASAVDGVCVFTFTDLLDMRETSKGKAMLGALKAFRPNEA